MPKPQQTAAFLLFLVAGLGAASASAAPAGLLPLIFRDDFEWGVSRWTDTVPDAGADPVVVWDSETTVPEIDLQNCDLPPGSYILRVRAESEHGAATKQVALLIVEVPCGGDFCREVTVTELP